jgi:hypothetical protein
LLGRCRFLALGLWLLASILDRTPALLLLLRVRQQVQPVLLALVEVLVQVMVQVQLEGVLALEQCRLLLARG